MRRREGRLAFSFAIAAALSCQCVSRQYAAAPQDSRQTDVLTVFMSLFGNQPDFTADIQVGRSRMKMARKNGKVRRDWLNPSKSKQAGRGIYCNIDIAFSGSAP